jgi:hypothetical protein
MLSGDERVAGVGHTALCLWPMLAGSETRGLWYTEEATNRQKRGAFPGDVGFRQIGEGNVCRSRRQKQLSLITGKKQ